MYLNLWHFWSYLISPVYFPISHDGNFSGHIDAEIFELLEVANLTIINVYKFTLDMPARTVTKEGLNDSRLWSSLLKRKKKKKMNASNSEVRRLSRNSWSEVFSGPFSIVMEDIFRVRLPGLLREKYFACTPRVPGMLRWHNTSVAPCVRMIKISTRERHVVCKGQRVSDIFLAWVTFVIAECV